MTIMKADTFKHHARNKFCVKLRKSATETLETLLQAFGKQYLAQTHVLSGTCVTTKAKWVLKMMRIQGG